MEHYKELIELRKKYQIIDDNIEQLNQNYPGTVVSSLFKDNLTERELSWLLYENLNLIDRRKTIFPRPIVMELKNYIFLLEKDEAVNELLKDLYKIEKYTPLTCLIPISNLSDTVKNSTLKLYRTLVGIEESMKNFAVGEYNEKSFSYCRYPKINKYVAKVFIENNCSILFTKFNNSNCVYFDPMSFENEELDVISEKISGQLGIKTIIDYDYDNYSISFLGDYSSIQIFNIINENEKYRIEERSFYNNLITENAIEMVNELDENKQKAIKGTIKPKINKPIFGTEEFEPEIIEIKPKFSGRFKKK